MAQWISMGPPETAFRRLSGRLKTFLAPEKLDAAVSLSVKTSKLAESASTSDALALQKIEIDLPVVREDNAALSAAKTSSHNSRVLPGLQSILAYASISKSRSISEPPIIMWCPEWIRRLLNKDWARRFTTQRKLRKVEPFSHTKTTNGARVTAVIGIHGWAVTQKLLQNFIGMPCSSEFYTSQMAAALRRSKKPHASDEAQRHECMEEHTIIEVPLNGHGCIMERVEAFSPNRTLREALAKATDVIVVAHSQGVPVGTLLLERLYAEGAMEGIQSITLVSMAGIFHGPFPQLGKNILIQYMETESSRELFELHAPFVVPIAAAESSTETSPRASLVGDMAARLRAALLRLLHTGVRVVAVGSWMDQLVPLYSSTLYGLFHPNITRLLYIEDNAATQHHAIQSQDRKSSEGTQEHDSFLPLLLALCLSIKNAGFSDHGLLVYLSEWIAGSIVNGDNGHSTIYTDQLVYESAARIIECSSRSGKMDSPPKYVPFEVPEVPNHYHVPWMMHALVTDPKLLAIPVIKRDIDAMVQAYGSWRPHTKALRDLKRKLVALGDHPRASL